MTIKPPYIILFHKFTLLVWGLLFATVALGQPRALVLSEDIPKISVGIFASYFEDKTGKLTIDSVSRPSFTPNFVRSKQNVMNFGFSSSAYWVRLDIQNQSPQIDDWLLEIGFPVLDKIDFYYLNDWQTWSATQMGDTYPFYAREIIHRNFIVPLRFKDTYVHTYYLRFKTRTAMQLPMMVYQTHDFYEREIQSEMAHGIFYGFMAVMVLYNLFIFFSLRDVNYFYYVLSIFASTFYFAAKAGHAYQYLWYNHVWLGDHFILITIGAWISTAAIFAKHFLNVKEYFPWLARLLNLVVLCGAAVVVMTFVTDYTTTSRFGTTLLGINTLIILTTGITCWAKGNQSARYFVVAWLIYLLGTLLLVLKTFNVMQANFLTNYASEIGSAIEVILLSLALSDKYSLLRQEKEKAQAEALDIQRRANEELEFKVLERTREINEKKIEIEAQNDRLETYNVEINKQKENIESSIKYAKRIQDVMLPSEEKLLECLPEHFIMFRPRDMVSGDFYWLTESQGKFILAVADCTGHGVPGSFMSMLGNNLLNEAANLLNVVSPDEILNHLHKGVRRTLRQDSTQNRDGMDIAICLLDKENKRIEFSGAKNPIIYIQNGELNLMRGDSVPIGGKQFEAERRFTKQYISFEETTMFYLFSDGYEDQFGGPEGRKFMIKHFKQLLLEVHQKPAKEQKEILDNRFDQWIGNTRQIDDVLVIGFRL